MALQTRDREFRHSRISYLDFKLLEMDRVLTSFLARVWHNGYPSRILRNIELTAPYFHSGHAWDLKQAVAVMGQSQLGEHLSEPEIDQVPS